MSRNIQNMPARYQALFSSWRNLTTVPNVYGNTGGWVNGVNTGLTFRNSKRLPERHQSPSAL